MPTHPRKRKTDHSAKGRYLAVEHVLAAVGRPPFLDRVESRLVDRDTYRVTLVTDTPGVGYCRSISFYIRMTSGGKVTYSNPPLAKFGMTQSEAA